MKYDELIEYINKYFENLEVSKIKFKGNKQGNNRAIWIYFVGHKYPCGLYVNKRFTSYTQSEPCFITGVMEGDKEYWSDSVRLYLLHFMFKRFWIWLKCVDKMYDQYVNGNCPKNSYINIRWNIDTFTSLIHDGWSIQKHTLSSILDFDISLKEMYNYYNKDVDDELYKNFGHIEYGDREYKELTTDEEFINVKIGF